MKISELIEKLKDMKAKHGDVKVYTTAFDYPEEASGVAYVKEGHGNGWQPSNTVHII